MTDDASRESIQGIFDALAAPFDPSEVKKRRESGREMSYITARTARRRLSDVLGPDNWWCSIEPTDQWIRCTLTISLPNGKTVTRQALGGYPKMPSDEDRVKGGDSDAFKRAAATFGVAEYLYGDEPRPAEASEEPRPKVVNRAPTAAPKREAAPKFSNARAFYAWAKEHGYLDAVAEIRDRESLPDKILDWSVDVLNAAASEIVNPPRS